MILIKDFHSRQKKEEIEMKDSLLIQKKPYWLVRILSISCVIGLLSLTAIAIYDYNYDYAGISKITLAEMTIAVKSIQEAVVKCHSESSGAAQPCKNAEDKAILLSTKDRSYVITANNNIIGIDYRRHVFLLAGYQNLDGKMAWDCFASTINISAASCRSGL